MLKSSADFLTFLKKSPTAFHAAEEIAARLKHEKFGLLDEREEWNLTPGKGYYLVRDGSLLAAFRLPEKAPTSAMILASHIDSPALKLKPCPEVIQRGIGELLTESYGAPLLHTWLDRDLQIAGRVSYLKGERIETETLCFKELILTIPNLAIHLDRTINEKGVLIQKQEHLKAIFSLNAKEGDFEKMLLKKCKTKKIFSFDLFLTPVEEPACIGGETPMIAGYRLDNLTSAYASLQALLDAKFRPHTLQMALFYDHEEIGSVSSRGADSVFAVDLLERITLSYKMSREAFFAMKHKSLCISSDVAHGFHPNFPEKYDTQNASYLGKGVVLKYNANQNYATSSTTASLIGALAAQAKIPLQPTASRSDIPSGSTIGSMFAAMTGIPTVDLGISLLAMHSIREIVALEDLHHLKSLLQQALAK